MPGSTSRRFGVEVESFTTLGELGVDHYVLIWLVARTVVFGSSASFFHFFFFFVAHTGLLPLSWQKADVLSVVVNDTAISVFLNVSKHIQLTTKGAEKHLLQK